MNELLTKELSARVEDINCMCGSSVHPDELKTASVEMYENLIESRRCKMGECENIGITYKFEKWLCEDHKPDPCTLGCGSGSDIFLDYSNLWICTNCYNDSCPCCLPDDGKECEQPKEYLHRCKKWICKQHIIK